MKNMNIFSNIQPIFGSINTLNNWNTVSPHEARKQPTQLDWAESGLHNSTWVGEADLPAMWSHPDSLQPVTNGQILTCEWSQPLRLYGTMTHSWLINVCNMNTQCTAYLQVLTHKLLPLAPENRNFKSPDAMGFVATFSFWRGGRVLV
jgi:hypothetical protein